MMSCPVLSCPVLPCCRADPEAVLSELRRRHAGLQAKADARKRRRFGGPLTHAVAAARHAGAPAAAAVTPPAAGASAATDGGTTLPAVTATDPSTAATAQPHSHSDEHKLRPGHAGGMIANGALSLEDDSQPRDRETDQSSSWDGVVRERMRGRLSELVVNEDRGERREDCVSVSATPVSAAPVSVSAARSLADVATAAMSSKQLPAGLLASFFGVGTTTAAGEVGAVSGSDGSAVGAQAQGAGGAGAQGLPGKAVSGSGRAERVSESHRARMRLLTAAAMDSKLKAGRKGGKGEGDEEDFGARDEDWDVYKLMSVRGDEEDEEEVMKEEKELKRLTERLQVRRTSP